MRVISILACGSLAVGFPLVAAAQDAAQALKPGLYLERPDGAPQPVPKSVSEAVETKGIMKAALTQGLAGPKFVARHDGAESDLIVSDAQPSFIFYFPPPMRRGAPMDMETMMEAADGLPMMSTHPREFTLVTMTVVEGTRVVDTGKLQKFKFTVTADGTRRFKVRPEDPLPPGEYAFFLSDRGKGGGMPVEVWAFSRR